MQPRRNRKIKSSLSTTAAKKHDPKQETSKPDIKCYGSAALYLPRMFTLDKARQIFPETMTADAVPAITARFKLLSAEDQLALIWFAYLEMGKTITVAAPGAARMALARPTLEEILAMSFDEQSKVMCDLAAKINSPISARYAFWSVNGKLCFWY